MSPHTFPMYTKKTLPYPDKNMDFYLVNEEDLRQYDNITSNRQLQFKDIIQNNHIAIHCNDRTLVVWEGRVVSFLCKKSFIHLYLI